MRGALVVVLLLLLVGLAATPVAAKERIVAKVRVPVSRAAEPGTQVTMVWELTAVEAGKARSFDADAIFLRLFGPVGSRTPRAYAERLLAGRYRATARVPRGGVRSVAIGLMGWNDHGPAPVRFPVIGWVFR
jgi:hypothetical protein